MLSSSSHLPSCLSSHGQQHKVRVSAVSTSINTTDRAQEAPSEGLLKYLSPLSERKILFGVTLTILSYSDWSKPDQIESTNCKEIWENKYLVQGVKVVRKGPGLMRVHFRGLTIQGLRKPTSVLRIKENGENLLSTWLMGI